MNRPSHSLSLWNDYVRAAPLVEQSDRIVLAEYLDSTTHEIPEVSPVDGVAHRSVTEEYRRFRVSDSLKGSAEADEVVYAVWTAGYTEGIGPGEATEFFAYETVTLETGQEYVLFMHSLPVAPGYPTKYGDVVWTIVGEPGVAVVSSEGRLSFKASERYKTGSITQVTNVRWFGCSIRINQGRANRTNWRRGRRSCCDRRRQRMRIGGTAKTSVEMSCRRVGLQGGSVGEDTGVHVGAGSPGAGG